MNVHISMACILQQAHHLCKAFWIFASFMAHLNRMMNHFYQFKKTSSRYNAEEPFFPPTIYVLKHFKKVPAHY